MPDLTIHAAVRGPVPLATDRPTGRVLASILAEGAAWLTIVGRARADTAFGPAGEVIDVHFHGVATATIDLNKGCVEIVLAEDADEGLLSVLIGGTVIATVLALLGHPVLHASAVRVDLGGRPTVIGFVGSSGMGKSTLATLACRDGAQLFADDVLRTDIVGDEVIAWPGATAARLRPAATELAHQSTNDVIATADGRTSAALPLAPGTSTPLGALVIPMPDRASELVTVERIEGVAAVLTLASHPRILGWQDTRTAAQAHLHWGELARRVPVMVVNVPWGPPFRDRLGAEVTAAVLAMLQPRQA